MSASGTGGGAAAPALGMIRAASRAALGRAAAGTGGQNFLGAPWVGWVVGSAPAAVKERVALRVLALSPHYFYDRDIRAEAERNRLSRRALAHGLLAQYVRPADRIIDYGCGPGYLAAAVSRLVRRVDAVDISAGVLACARVLNGRPNVSYLTPAGLACQSEPADLAYSFAVLQHLRDADARLALELLASKLRPGGQLLLHFAEPGPGGWRSQADWEADTSAAGRLKLRYGLHCFGRTSGEMTELVAASGFTDITVAPVAACCAELDDDDLRTQLLLSARGRK
jgi:SAM-dependent methyltransferase